MHAKITGFIYRVLVCYLVGVVVLGFLSVGN